MFYLPLAAIGAGIISFSSPCCLPLIPGYLSFLSATPVNELDQRQARASMLRASILFVVGFSLVFTLLGVASSVFGGVLLRHLPALTRLAGIGIIIMGLSALGIVHIPVLSRQVRVQLNHQISGPRGALPFGMAFAAGWTPCIGPILATALALAAATRTAWAGGLLLLCYSAGLGIPFIVLALGYQRLRGSLAFLRQHGQRIEQIGGLFLIVVGVLFVTGHWSPLFIPLQRYFARFGWPPV